MNNKVLPERRIILAFLLSLAVALMVAVSAAAVYADEESIFTSGTGTVNDPFGIKPIGSLEGITVPVSAGMNFSGQFGIPDIAAGKSPVQTREVAGKYVLMNIPYSKFYAAEIGSDGDASVDAVTSATKNKPRTGSLAGGSYHKNPDGTDISGVIYPVYVSDMSQLEGLTQITDESSVDITVTNRGQTVTTTYQGKDALFESDDYSYYELQEEPASFKRLIVDENGNFSFSAAEAEPQTIQGAAGEVTVGARHADIEIKLTLPSGVQQGDPFSGVILTDENGQKYALRHIANVWRGTEIGWNLGEFDLGGKTIKNIRYITQNGVIDYPVDITVSNAAYVLMNIPYQKFYSAEVGENGMDAVTSATKNKTRNYGLTAGSFHSEEGSTEIEGAVYPVFVEDMNTMENALPASAKKVTDSDSLSFDVTGRGGVTHYDLAGKDALFEAPAYSYYVMTDKPANYKKLTISADNDFSFGAIAKRATAGTLNSVKLNLADRHVDYAIQLTSESISGNVNAVVITAGDKKYGLGHVTNIWRGTNIGMNADSENYADIVGKDITNITYYTSTGVYSFDTNINIPEDVAAAAKQNVTDAQAAVTEAQAAVTEAQAAVDALTEESTDAEKAAAYQALAEASAALAEAQNAAADAQTAQAAVLNKLLAKAQRELEEANAKLAELAVVDISNYAVTLEYTSKAYTGKPLKPSVKVAGLTDGDYKVEYSNNTAIGTATVTITGVEAKNYKGTITKTFKITKKAQTLKATGKKKTVKFKDLKKKNQTVAGAITVKNAQGKVTYKKASGSGKITVNAKNGKFTVKKGLNKGTYKVKVNVKAAGNKTFLAGSKTTTVTIIVK